MAGDDGAVFAVNGRARAVRAAADSTLLDYLRARGHAGVKEGCAAGDCGACTVAAREKGGGWRPVNSCICLLGQAHGWEIFTADGIAQNNRLHPAQRAMAQHHGAQCGFCTPGFVMSLFSHFMSSRDFSREAVQHAVAGNLCRCTGYRPILHAGMSLKNTARRAPPPCSPSLAAAARRESDVYDPEKRAVGACFLRPKNCAELDAMIKKHPRARLLAGGTDLALEVTQQWRDIDSIIHLNNVSEMRGARASSAKWRIGAATPLSGGDGWVADAQWRELLLRFGSPQIRGQATLGGNIANASPIADSPPPLLALNASLILRRLGKTRRLPLGEFYLDYKKTALRKGEYILAVEADKLRAGDMFFVRKISKRFEDDISAVCGAFLLRARRGVITHARVAFGGMAAIPARAAQCEAALQGAPFAADTFAAAAAALDKDFSPLTDLRAPADYRRAAARALLYQFWLEFGAKTPRRELRLADFAAPSAAVQESKTKR